MVYRPRTLEDRFVDAANQFPVVLLAGPRQVGKTTLLEHLMGPSRRYVSLDDIALRTLARTEPDLFLQRFSPPVLIDEVQYAPELFSSIKQHVDRHRAPGAFWLTGSQQFSMMQRVTESLAGRVAIVNLLGFSMRESDGRSLRMPPFVPVEAALEPRLADHGVTSLTSVYRRVFMGSYPALVTGQVRDLALFFRSYVQTYLERDVRSLVNVGDLETFGRFLRVVAARTGQLVNYSDLARDGGISVNTARSWLSTLVASFQVFLLPPFHENISKRLYRTPKLYFLDTGLCAYLTGWTSPETLEGGAMSGAILETWVVAEIIKSWWHRLEEPQLSFYRDKDGREIDLVILLDGKLHPVEIKKTAGLARDAVRTFRALGRSSRPVGPGAVLCLNPRALPLDAMNTSIPVGVL